MCVFTKMLSSAIAVTSLALTMTVKTSWGAEYFAAPDVVDTEELDCSTPERAGSLPNALSRITAADDVVTLLPGIYHFSGFTPYTKTSDVNETTKSYFVGKIPALIHSQEDDPSTVTLLGAGKSVDGRCFCFGGPFVLSGVTITNFYTSGSAAAVYSTDRSTIVSNCIINGNEAAKSNGALYNLKSVDCSFYGNYSQKESGVGASLDLVRCHLIYNGGGGNDYYGTGASVKNSTADGCTFEDSYVKVSAYKAGLMIAGSTLTNCVFRNANNTITKDMCTACTFYDCKFYGNYVSSALVSASTLYDCVFSNNYGKCSNGLCVNGSTCYSCRFVQNVQTNTSYYCGGAAGYGGSYFDCQFVSNEVSVAYSSRGGALLSPVIASNCVFVANTAYTGGAVAGKNAGLATDYLVQNSFFTNNWVAKGSGGCLNTVTVSNCVVHGSHVDANGTWGGAGVNVNAFNSIFEYNVLHGLNYVYSGGGALGSGGCAVNCIFRYNKDLGTSTAGACAEVTMTNCLVYGNYAESKTYGGFAVYATKPVVNCTIVSNTVPSGTAACDGTFINCIIVDNAKDIMSTSKLASHMTNCLFCTTEGTTALDTNGCLQVSNGVKVKFQSLDPESENAFRLTRRSPARDFGCDVGLTAADRDLDGLSRVCEKAIDAGCYECNIPAPGLLLMVK